jgi:hypothetical protein
MTQPLETVEVVQGGEVAMTPGALWDPVVGEETHDFLKSLPAEAQPRVEDEARQILSRSTDPHGHPATRAGLVVGYVQSGKTTSMIAAAAMGRDNRFGLIVFIAGTSDILLGQSRQRLSEGLRLTDSDAWSRWEQFDSPKPNSPESARLAAALKGWPRAGEDRSTILVTVMKQHQHLKYLVEVLREAGERTRLSDIPALVFDDEADQASPNLKSKPGQESATYRDLRQVRAALPWHTLLQYTATPQALLLISIADEISPDFTYMLAPGQGYVGGKYFFQDHAADFVRFIPDEELDGADSEATEPPESLHKALALFSLGAAYGLADKANRGTQRSMLIHPSHETLPHARFAHWIQAAAEHWAETLDLPKGDEDRCDLAESVFAPAHDDLALSVPTLPPLDELLDQVPVVLRKLHIEKVNRAKNAPSPSIAWSKGYAWALVGGQLLDRGFTVEGLTVTYMPRSLGVGHADTVQQRARFFGYKAAYAGLCRAWLDSRVATAFGAYVAHEESVRAQLAGVTRTGRSLRDWKRAFLLDRELKPTRTAVIRLSVERPAFGDNKWFAQRHLLAPDSDLNSSNRDTVRRFVASLALRPDDGHPDRTDVQRHLVATVPASRLLEELVSRYAMYEGDLPEYTAMQLLVADLRDKAPDSPCVVYIMSQGRTRERTPRRDVVELHEGANSRGGQVIYPGDSDIRDPNALSIQIFSIDVTEHRGGPALESDVPALAFWVPQPLAAAFLVAT